MRGERVMALTRDYEPILRKYPSFLHIAAPMANHDFCMYREYSRHIDTTLRVVIG